ncbi:MAG TPA: carboxypeptidase regulatory-like domain-containing protein [Vicinamibacterales bacterium]
MLRRCFSLALLVVLAAATHVFAQGNPTGSIIGHVTDADGLAIPGVTVTAVSPALQGSRIAVTSANGDYIIPFLPAGSYEVTFEIQSFGTAKRTINLKLAETQPLNMELAVATVAETVTVTAAATDLATTRTVTTTMKAENVELIPIGRSLEAAALMAPAASDNGPAGNIMISGALSYDNLNLVNGVDVNENLRGQARPLYVEDAVQETSVSSGNLSAEFGRFQGGVINMVTKSGGNQFTGSFRTTFTNDAWKSLTPYPGDSSIDLVVPAYEATFGGPILKDKLWFFSAGRYQKNSSNITAPYTGLNYIAGDDDKRLEGKATYAINARNTAKVSYLDRRVAFTNNSFSTIMDAASLYDNTNTESLLAANYQTVLSTNVFIEAQYSSRKYDNVGTGSKYMDLLKGTPIWDRSRGQARFNAPTFCAVCPNAVDLKNNEDAYAKLNYFLSTKRFGSHSIVTGFDVFNEMRENNQNSSASEFRVQATGTIIDGQTIYPIFRTGNTTFVEWLPVFEETKGNNLRTYSGFVNDTWRLNDNFGFNVGLRFDKNSTFDQGAKQVGNASSLSPRLGVTYDIKGDGKWLANGGFAHYVAAFNTQIADASSAAGRQASFSYFYAGPSVNDGAGPYVNSQQALQILFDWFNANGGTSRTTRNQPTVPGVNTAVNPDIRSANSNEFIVGLAHELGSKGAIRADFIYRKYYDFYGNYIDLSTGVVTEPRTGQQFNLSVVNNTNDVVRDYKGLGVQFDYRPLRDLQLNANWMLSYARGSVEGEDVTNGATRASANEYPEFRDASWNYPVGYTNGDQRHKVRAWATYNAPLPQPVGRLTVGLMQRYDTGLGYDYNMAIDTRPYVTNPGYLVPPSSVTYYVSGRGEFHFDGTWRTDLSLSWNHDVPALARSQVFLRFVMQNIFNNMNVENFNTTIQGRSQDSTMAAFNPFNTVPVEGVHWKRGPSFGEPTSPTSYQSPREYNFSVGFRF